MTSVQEQAGFPGELRHLLVVDGPAYANRVQDLINTFCADQSPRIPTDILYLPYNTGEAGYYGHRIYSGISYFLNCEFVLFLDQDNWIDSDHVASLVELLESTAAVDFAYSLRKIFTKDRKFVCDDDCESLGKWPIWFTESEPHPVHNYLIDTSSYCFRREVLIALGHAWHNGWVGDRLFLKAATEKRLRYETSGRYSLNYRLGGRLDGRVNGTSPEFFLDGNQHMRMKYRNTHNFPWKKSR